MKKFFTFFAAALLSISMFGKTVTEDVSMNASDWNWGKNCNVTAVGNVLQGYITSEYGYMAIGWDPAIDLSSWDKLVVEVANTNGCGGEHYLIKAFLRDLVNKDVENGQMEAAIGPFEPEGRPYTLEIHLKEEGKNVNLTACGVIGIQVQPNGAEFMISRVYFAKEVEEAIDYYLVGNFNNWQADAAYKFAVNPDNAAEQMLLGVDLAKDDSLKVIGTDGQTATWYPDNAPNYVIAKNGTYDIYFRPDGMAGDDWYYHCLYVAEKVDETYIAVAFPSANRPAYISVAGTFKAGQWGMRIFNEPWFVCDEDLYTGKGDVLKFRDSDNANYVLCKKNGENWEQVLLYCKDYAVVPFKGETARVIEDIDFSDANMYAWKEGMPEPSGLQNIVLTEQTTKMMVDGVMYIVRDGKLYNMQGAQVR